MKLNYHKSHRGGGQSQALHNVSFFNNCPDPSLWNSQAGRREFLGKIGKASVGTAIVLNGLKLEVLATYSGGPDPRAQELTTTGSPYSAHQYEITNFKFKVKNVGSTTASGSLKVKFYDISGENPVERSSQNCGGQSYTINPDATTGWITAVETSLIISILNDAFSPAPVASYKIYFVPTVGAEEEIDAGDLPAAPTDP